MKYKNSNITKVLSAIIVGIETHLITVEISTDQFNGYSFIFNIVGMVDRAVQESKKRITAVLSVLGINLKGMRIVVNLAPATLNKVGSQFDLPIATAILAHFSMIRLNSTFTKETVIMGELSFDGTINPVTGIMGVALDAHKFGIKNIVIPAKNYVDALTNIPDITIIPVHSIHDFILFTQTKKLTISSIVAPEQKDPVLLDFANISGQKMAKRMLQIAAAGSHNCILMGPPGSGKTMLASALPSILPPMSANEILEVNRIHSAISTVSHFIKDRPFRNPHYSTSESGLVGGGHTMIRPGEASLAHNGVLFLDELAEFSRGAIESLRNPIEQRQITIARSKGSVTFPCSFMLICALNPCPCGNVGNNKKKCECFPIHIYNYLRKISGPFLDRIDLQIFVQSVDISELHNPGSDLSSAVLKEGVIKARQKQQERYGSQDKVNAYLTPSELSTYCPLTETARTLLDTCFEKFDMSMRSYHKIIKVARTIADIAGEDNILPDHIKEALMYRGIEQKISILKKKL
jgi:magnesium chelatase family protein